MSAQEDYYATKRGFELKDATVEQLRKALIDQETKNMVLENRLWSMNQRYGHFEALYDENRRLTDLQEHNAEQFQKILEFAKKGKL